VPTFLVLGLVVAGVSAGLIGVAAAVGWALRTTWASAWRGRDVVVVQGILRDEVWVDGVRVASFSVGELSGLVKGSRMHGKVRTAVHGEVPLVAVIDGNFGRASRYAVYVGGERIAGDFDDEDARVASRAGPEPADPRWTAARALLDALDKAREPSVREGAIQLGHGLRDALHHLASLRETAAAHQALGGDVAAAERTLDDEVERWLAALREVHLQATVRSGGADEILSKVRAEREVDAAVRERARALVRARRAPEP
jgi:hypothetical protein